MILPCFYHAFITCIPGIWHSLPNGAATVISFMILYIILLTWCVCCTWHLPNVHGPIVFEFPHHLVCLYPVQVFSHWVFFPGGIKSSRSPWQSSCGTLLEFFFLFEILLSFWGFSQFLPQSATYSTGINLSLLTLTELVKHLVSCGGYYWSRRLPNLGTYSMDFLSLSSLCSSSSFCNACLNTLCTCSYAITSWGFV